MVVDASMLTEAAQRNWVKAVEKEIEARYSWHERWGWMPAVIEETSRKLKELKQRHSVRLLEETTGAIKKPKPPVRDPRPFPNSTNHEYGWLVMKPEYQIESYGPWPNNRRQRIEPTEEEVQRAKKKNKGAETDQSSLGTGLLGLGSQPDLAQSVDAQEVKSLGREEKKDCQKGDTKNYGKKLHKIYCCTDKY